MTEGRGSGTGAAAALALVCAFAALHAQAPASGSSQRSKGAEGCRYEENCECAVPGITIRWKGAYCMFVNETDDLESAGVGACLHAPEPRTLERASACARNAYWKEQLCRARHEDDAGAVRECVADAQAIPPFVEFGPGARPHEGPDPLAGDTEPGRAVNERFEQ